MSSLETRFDPVMTLPLIRHADPAPAIGGKIRALRQRLKRTLGETAAAAGISAPFLSQVERGQANPSVKSLAGIAQALGVTLQYFVGTPTEATSVCRGSEVTSFRFAGSENLFGRLTNASADRALEAVLVTMPAGQRSSELRTRAGEAFIYVTRGAVSLTLKEKTFVLQAGDSAHYSCTQPHAWANDTNDAAVLVWVGTPGLL
jgi:transcriptional regulator with XRE-family HTH domain